MMQMQAAIPRATHLEQEVIPDVEQLLVRSIGAHGHDFQAYLSYRVL